MQSNRHAPCVDTQQTTIKRGFASPVHLPRHSSIVAARACEPSH
ncbi:hypothetical protein PC114_g15221 [Phytophthora cactorum]|uniref:Uncharacterized protein n=1 Tax=Phytophthora cactorum TaxID=29920 RepID=A0A8T1CHW8_9STRA|nr:hypothetical protein PC114_g15221 [Phytophthora cactorum]KAG2921952.1 hypothetical protein PC117_g16099 [Phytophthora cactorum]